MPDKGKKHIILPKEHFSTLEKYLYAGGTPISKRVNPQDRASHANHLKSQIFILKNDMIAARAIQEKSKVEMDYGLLVEFESFDGIGEVLEDKSIVRTGDFRNIRYINGKAYATFFIPDGKLTEFENKLQEYISYAKNINGDAKDNQPLIDTIKNLRKASIEALWTDTIPLPATDDEVICWEVWIAARDNIQKQKKCFIDCTKQVGIEISENHIDFRDRSIYLARGTKRQIADSIDLLNCIAELRRAKTTADFFTELPAADQKQWLDELLQRASFQRESDEVPYVCILDTGINSSHPLLEKATTQNDLYTINSAWGKNDIAGHGTGIAGLVLFGDLTKALESDESFEITHRIESSKLINKPDYVPETSRPLELYAYHTQQAVSQAEIPNAQRKRIFQLAITAEDFRDKGRPSSWSAALDKLAYGENQGQRLFVVSSGNIGSDPNNGDYPQCNKDIGIHDPAQAWNAITVGAYTEKFLVSPDEKKENCSPIAKHGELSPYSTTSFSWDMSWPYKPDIVMEGGNKVKVGNASFQAASLSLLTTHHDFTKKLFTPIWATSAASALASKFCAHIISQYPEIKTQTIRALMIHSAEWTPGMLRQFDCSGRDIKKSNYRDLIRICGFGVPNLNRALESFKNNFTLIIEDIILPYQRTKSSKKNKEMKFYELPFPKNELEALGSTEIEMRITLSYFIEPNPSSRGRSKYNYESHGLRFTLKTPTETINNFKGRVTKSLREENEEYRSDEIDTRWKLGVKNRTKGSIHSDIWNGSAAELAASNILAIYPVIGWWRKNNDTINNKAEYSLVISIKTSADVDLMTPVETIIENKIKTSITI